MKLKHKIWTELSKKEETRGWHQQSKPNKILDLMLHSSRKKQKHSISNAIGIKTTTKDIGNKNNK